MLAMQGKLLTPCLINLPVSPMYTLPHSQGILNKQQCQTRQRVQSYCGFTLCQGSVRTALPLPTTTRRTRCFQVGDYAKISVSTTERRCRPS